MFGIVNGVRAKFRVRRFGNSVIDGMMVLQWAVLDIGWWGLLDVLL